MNTMSYEMYLQEFKNNVWMDLFLFFRIPWVFKVAKSFLFSEVFFQFIPYYEFEKNIERLKKKYPSIEEDLAKFKNNFTGV